jgi:hypothetical protein
MTLYEEKKNILLSLFGHILNVKGDFFRYKSDYDGTDRLIITRTGIDKIEREIAVRVEVTEVLVVPYGNRICATVKVVAPDLPFRKRGKLKGLSAYAIGYASPDNTDPQNTYYPNLAEKRARHILLLKIAGLYQHGIHSEVESDKFASSSPNTNANRYDIERVAKEAKKIMTEGV